MTERERMHEPLIYDEVEVFGPGEGPQEQPQADILGTPAELLDMLVSRFEDTLISQEREMSALRSALQEAQEIAALDRSELETAQQVCRILERDKARLAAELEELRGRLGDEQQILRDRQELEELRQQVVTLKKRRRLALELDELRHQVAALSSSSDRMLEQLLGGQNYG